MRISRATIESPANRDSEIGPLPVGLSVVYGPSGSGKSRLAALLSETLFGLGRTAHVDGARAATIDSGVDSGAVEIDSSLGRFRLRRQPRPGEVARFTIANLDGGPASPDTLTSLFGGVGSGAAASVCFSSPWFEADFARLLSDEVARELHRLGGRAPATVRNGLDTTTLLSRRDEVAHEIEHRLSDRRRASGELEAELEKLDAESAGLAARRETLDKALSGVEGELSIVESRLRYRAIAEQTDRAAQQREAADWRPKLEELDDQIEQWRATLAEIEQRESEVRSELSLIHPDDSEPTLPLADQRAGIAVSRRLVEDLESEVARLARATDSDTCVCRDAHPRLNPLVDTLGKQLARLAELGEQQEQALHVQSLRGEADHLARSQDDLRKQLDHLLGRRQALWRTTRARPDEGQFVEVDASATGEQRAELEERRRELVAEIAGLDRRLDEIATQKQSLTHQRSSLLSDATLEALQAELHDLQAKLEVGATTNFAPSRVADDVESVATRWRASEWFAKLTDGRYGGLRLVDAGRRIAAVEPSGAEWSAESLSNADRRLAAISLRLAMIGGLSQNGARLPLVLDEPFTGLDSRQAAILANVLDDFSRLGFQVLVFTDNQAALDRFKALGAPLLPVVAGERIAPPVPRVVTRRIEVEPIPTPHREPVVKSTRLSSVATTETTSEYLLAPEDAIERFPVPIADRTGAFARSRIRTVEDLMTADPSAVAEELDRDDVTAELVALWQTHLEFVCFVPGMTFQEASLLTSTGVLGVEDLAELDHGDLEARVASLLASDSGSRYKSLRLSSDRSADWIHRARRGAERWRSTDSWSRYQRHRGERRSRVDANRTASRKVQASTRRTLRVRSADTERTERREKQNGAVKREWRFYLETGSPVVDAPSIGPKTAKRLEKAGVRTVSDLLSADADVVAEALDNSRITAETVVAWQHQASLVCRIPQLRGHDAQILVACGFTQPEEIASMKPAELLEFVEPFCATSEGQKILRNGKEPDLAEVTDWINWARHCRLLGAA